MNLPEPAATADSDWRSLSACLDADPELFFPLSAWGPSLTQLATAKAVCAGCEVRTECLHFALRTGQEYGVWGGTSEDERRTMRRTQLALEPRAVTEGPRPVPEPARHRGQRGRIADPLNDPAVSRRLWLVPAGRWLVPVAQRIARSHDRGGLVARPPH